MYRVGVLLAVLSSTACYDELRVRPDELPKLNDSYTTTMGYVPYRTGRVTGVATMTDRSVRHLIGEDGKVVEVKGEASVVLETARGNLDFAHPIIAELHDDQVLAIAGGNRPMNEIPLGDVRSATVSAYNPTMTMWALLGGSLAVTIPLTFLLLSAAH